jgi:hypothetical protein
MLLNPALLLRSILLLTTLRSYSYSGFALPPRVRFAILLSRLAAQSTRCAQTIKKQRSRLRRGIPCCCSCLFSLLFLFVLSVVPVVDSLLLFLFVCGFLCAVPCCCFSLLFLAAVSLVCEFLCAVLSVVPVCLWIPLCCSLFLIVCGFLCAVLCSLLFVDSFVLFSVPYCFPLFACCL